MSFLVDLFENNFLISDLDLVLEGKHSELVELLTQKS